jgi:hypothetical protein
LVSGAGFVEECVRFCPLQERNEAVHAPVP